MCWTFCFVRTKHGYSSVDTLIVKTVQYGALKTHMRYMKVLYIRQNWCFMLKCLENELWDHCSLNICLLWKIIHVF